MRIGKIGRKTSRSLLFLAVAVGSLVVTASWVTGRGSGAFDLSQHTVPLDQIVSGGPPKDGIPALLEPQFMTASEAWFLRDRDRVLGLSQGGEAKAYPIRILNWHEVVNDTIDGRPVVVTYCPLCGTGIAFEARVGERVHTFGVSGLLYQSDLLMYDHQTESLWSQVSMEAIAGPLAGQKLSPVYLSHTTWEDWKTEHQATLVLSRETGYRRDYSRDPYEGYARRPGLFFDVPHVDHTYHPKAWVVGVEVKGTYKAYAFSELEKAGGFVTDRVNGQKIYVRHKRRARSASVTDAEGNPMPSVRAFWFAWYAFHPDTQVYSVP